jgi:hypothetical protein
VAVLLLGIGWRCSTSAGTPDERIHAALDRMLEGLEARERRQVLAAIAPEWFDAGVGLDRAALGQALGSAFGSWPLGPSDVLFRAELPFGERQLEFNPSDPDRARMTARLEVERQVGGREWSPWGTFDVELQWERRGRDWFVARSHTTPIGPRGR